MGVLWDEDLYLLTPEELKKLPPWMVVKNISDVKASVKDVLANEDNLNDLRYGVTPWGVPPVEYEIYGKIVVKKDAFLDGPYSVFP